MLVDGQPMDEEQLFRRLKARHPEQEVRLEGLNLDVPYRCLGATIFALQRARVPIRIGFISEPPPPDEEEGRE